MNRLRKSCGLSAALLIATMGCAMAQSAVTGVVYQDANGNGKKDKKETGIAGVSVSNGVEVTVTDAQGRYQLPVGNDNMIFVIKPAGYKVPVNALNQPQHYYAHKPAGSPALKYKGVPASGNLPKSVDFPLTKYDESADFTALVFGDPQAYNLDEIGYFSKSIVSEVKGISNVAFGLSLGDLVGDDLSLHNPYIKAVNEIGLPWYNVIGNHDMNYDAVTDSLSDESFEAGFGPANYAYNYGNAHFIVLDDILYPDPRDGKSYWGGFRKSQLDFVENDLKHVPKDKLIVLSFHIPLMHKNEDAFRNADRQRLFDLLKDFPHTLSMSAHTHLQRQTFYGKTEGWQQEKPHHEYNAGTTSGDWYSGEIGTKGFPDGTMRDGTPRGYAFLNIRGNQYTIDYKVAGAPKEYQIKLFHPKVVNQEKPGAAGIYANFFMGDKSSKVEYRVGNGEWKKMVYVEEADPAYENELYKWDTTEELLSGRRPSNPENCTHLWRGPVPRGLAVGEHQIDVRATDMFGKTFTQTGKIRYAQPK